MTLRDPGLVLRLPAGAEVVEQFFEVSLDEFRIQKKLPCARGPDGEWLVEACVWDEWQRELVEYFICNGHTGSEIEAFIKNHVLGGSGKVGRT